MLNKRKDEKIQVYSAVEQGLPNSTIIRKYRKFIYDRDVFERGGLWANAREMTNTEVVNSGLEIAKVNVKFTVNRNRDITADCKVIYRGNVYDISSVDNTDFRSPDISFTAVLTSDTTKYTGDIFADDEDLDDGDDQ